MTSSLPAISVIIPVRDCEGTLPDALDSLLAQTHTGWEAIVLDDGSADESAAIVRAYARREARIAVARGPCRGAAAARNLGVRLSRYDWILFLDADDLLAPAHLERLAERVAAEPELDAVRCGWALVSADGRLIQASPGEETESLFHLFTRACLFPIHACIIRREVVERLGGFDESLPACQDWDFWQRVTRLGVRFGLVREILAYYRARSGSTSCDTMAVLRHGLRVIDRGHDRDPRVPSPDIRYADGSPAERLPTARLNLVAWCVGLALGEGLDPRVVLAEVKGPLRGAALGPHDLAAALRLAVLRARGLPPEAWPRLHSELKGELESVLTALEARTGVTDLARATARELEPSAAGLAIDTGSQV